MRISSDTQMSYLLPYIHLSTNHYLLSLVDTQAGKGSSIPARFLANQSIQMKELSKEVSTVRQRARQVRDFKKYNRQHPIVRLSLKLKELLDQRITENPSLKDYRSALDSEVFDLTRMILREELRKADERLESMKQERDSYKARITGLQGELGNAMIELSEANKRLEELRLLYREEIESIPRANKPQKAKLQSESLDKFF